MRGENAAAGLSRDLACLEPQIRPWLPLCFFLCACHKPAILGHLGKGNRKVVASKAAHSCNVEQWAPHHQEYSNKVQIITSQGIPALGQRLDSKVSSNSKNPLISLLLDQESIDLESSMGALPCWVLQRDVLNLSELNCLSYLLLLGNLPICSCCEEPRTYHISKCFQNLLFFIIIPGRVGLLLLLSVPSEDDHVT